ncbi:hypothetical protein [Vibrio owensii]|uniref:hypothetical protein n=1 Tax=Vibrio owensii TaxID=696485 RepID=UPI003CC594A0
MKTLSDLCISVTAFMICVAMLYGSYLLIVDVSAKAEGKDFRQHSYLLIEGEEYIVDIITSKDQCTLTNRLRDTRYVKYERFDNSCDFIFADASDIHRILKTKSKIIGAIAFESKGHFRYYPLYKGDFGQLEMSDGIKPLRASKVPLNDYKVRAFNQRLRASGLY